MKSREQFEAWYRLSWGHTEDNEDGMFDITASGSYNRIGVRIAADAWQASRAATLQAGNSPEIPDSYVLVPMRLTAENGAKALLSGEFSETKYINCPECFGDDECETCDGSGQIEINVPVTWTTIKAIWAQGVEHFAAAPQEVTSARVHPARDE